MLKEKVALVTGASRGIGRAIAEELGQCGAHVAVVYQGNAEAARSTCAALERRLVQAEMFACDVSDFEQCQALVNAVVARFGHIDILVNNAGITNDGLTMRMSEAQWDSVLDTNLKGAFHMIRFTSPLFLKQRSGRIINVTSIAGLIGNAGQANYAASKAGMIGLTKSVAREFASRGITCNAVAPGLIDTDMARKMRENTRQTLIDSVPMKRMGTPADVARLVSFLASDAASYLTGQTIAVDGGISM